MAKRKKSHRRRGTSGMSGFGKKIDFSANLKNALSKSEVKSDLTGLWAVPIYLGFASLFKLQGYIAFFVSFGLTWLTGAALRKPEICRTAWGIAAAHFVMAEFTPFFQNTLKMPLWRFGNYQFALNTQNTTGTSGLAYYIPDSEVSSFFDRSALVPAQMAGYEDEAMQKAFMFPKGDSNKVFEEELNVDRGI